MWRVGLLYTRAYLKKAHFGGEMLLPEVRRDGKMGGI